MPSAISTNIAPSLQPALELIYLARLQPEEASKSLRRLLLANPDYFGTLPESSFKVVLNINGDTRYESLGQVRYIPLLGAVCASIVLNQDHGYSYLFGQPESPEYVRFYLSYDHGDTWIDEGLTSLKVSDQAVAFGKVCLVSKQIELQLDAGFGDQSPILRATLSWKTPPPPNAPDWTPLWGNVSETQITNAEIGFRRRSRLQTGSWDVSVDETVSEERVGRSFDFTDVRPVGDLTPTGSFSTPGLHQEDHPQCTV
jgi:hypothetical protein